VPIVVTCPECKAKLKAPEGLVGKKVKCPGCQSAVLVTEPAAAPAPAAPRPQAVAKLPAKKKSDEPLDDLDDLDESPRKPAARGKAASRDDDDDYDDAPRKPVAKKKGRDDDDDYDDDDAPRKPLAKKKGRDDDDYDDDYDDDDRPRGKGKKGKATAVGGSTTEEDRSQGFMFYIILIAGSFLGVGPVGGLVWWFMKRGESKFVDHVGKQYINHAITIFLLAMSLLVLLGGMGVGGFIIEQNVIGFIGFGLLGLCMMGIGLMEMIFLLMAMFKTKAGEWYRYPMTWQLLK